MGGGDSQSPSQGGGGVARHHASIPNGIAVRPTSSTAKASASDVAPHRQSNSHQHGGKEVLHRQGAGSKDETSVPARVSSPTIVAHAQSGPAAPVSSRPADSRSSGGGATAPSTPRRPPPQPHTTAATVGAHVRRMSAVHAEARTAPSSRSRGRSPPPPPLTASEEAAALLLNFSAVAEQPSHTAATVENPPVPSAAAASSGQLPHSPPPPQDLPATTAASSQPAPASPPGPATPSAASDAALTTASFKPTKQKRKRNAVAGPSRQSSADRDRPPHWMGEDNSVIRCICGFTEDDGFTIQCEGCNAWEHGLCFGYRDEASVPDTYFCELCDPRPFDAVRARLQQMEVRAAFDHRRLVRPVIEEVVEQKKRPKNKRQKTEGRSSAAAQAAAAAAAAAAAVQAEVAAAPQETRDTPVEESIGKDTQQSMAPPATKPKSRRNQPSKPRSSKTSETGHASSVKDLGQDEYDYFRILPWELEFTPIKDNVIRGVMARHAMTHIYREWVEGEEVPRTSRPIQNDSGLPSPTDTGVLRLSPDDMFSSTDFSILAPPVPPVFVSGPDLSALAAPTTIRHVEDSACFLPAKYIEPGTGIYTRPALYGVFSQDPIPAGGFVDEYRCEVIDAASYRKDPINQYSRLGIPKPYVHSVGPPVNLVLDARSYGSEMRFVRNGCHPNAVIRPMVYRPGNGQTPKLRFGVFASRDLNKNEEIVVGWEWDDQHVVHTLRSLIDSTTARGPHLPHEVVEFLTAKFHIVLTTLFGTFSSCACTVDPDCVYAQMRRLVAGEPFLAKNKKRIDLGELIGAVRGWRRREIEEAAAAAAAAKTKHYRVSGEWEVWRAGASAGNDHFDRRISPPRSSRRASTVVPSERGVDDDESVAGPPEQPEQDLEPQQDNVMSDASRGPDVQAEKRRPAGQAVEAPAKSPALRPEPPTDSMDVDEPESTVEQPVEPAEAATEPEPASKAPEAEAEPDPEPGHVVPKQAPEIPRKRKSLDAGRRRPDVADDVEMAEPKSGPPSVPQAPIIEDEAKEKDAPITPTASKSSRPLIPPSSGLSSLPEEKAAPEPEEEQAEGHVSDATTVTLPHSSDAESDADADIRPTAARRGRRVLSPVPEPPDLSASPPPAKKASKKKPTAAPASSPSPKSTPVRPRPTKERKRRVRKNVIASSDEDGCLDDEAAVTPPVLSPKRKQPERPQPARPAKKKAKVLKKEDSDEDEDLPNPAAKGKKSVKDRIDRDTDRDDTDHRSERDDDVKDKPKERRPTKADRERSNQVKADKSDKSEDRDQVERPHADKPDKDKADKVKAEKPRSDKSDKLNNKADKTNPDKARSDRSDKSDKDKALQGAKHADKVDKPRSDRSTKSKADKLDKADKINNVELDVVSKDKARASPKPIDKPPRSEKERLEGKARASPKPDPKDKPRASPIPDLKDKARSSPRPDGDKPTKATETKLPKLSTDMSTTSPQDLFEAQELTKVKLPVESLDEVADGAANTPPAEPRTASRPPSRPPSRPLTPPLKESPPLTHDSAPTTPSAKEPSPPTKEATPPRSKEPTPPPPKKVSMREYLASHKIRKVVHTSPTEPPVEKVADGLKVPEPVPVADTSQVVTVKVEADRSKAASTDEAPASRPPGLNLLEHLPSSRGSAGLGLASPFAPSPVSTESPVQPGRPPLISAIPSSAYVPRSERSDAPPPPPAYIPRLSSSYVPRTSVDEGTPNPMAPQPSPDLPTFPGRDAPGPGPSPLMAGRPLPVQTPPKHFASLPDMPAALGARDGPPHHGGLGGPALDRNDRRPPPTGPRGMPPTGPRSGWGSNGPPGPGGPVTGANAAGGPVSPVQSLRGGAGYGPRSSFGPPPLRGGFDRGGFGGFRRGGFGRGRGRGM